MSAAACGRTAPPPARRRRAWWRRATGAGGRRRHAAARDPRPAGAGEAQYAIFCTPCHGAAGAGDGMIVRHGFPAPPSYHTARLRAAPARHFYDVIGDGYGIMYGYGDRLAPPDRWAVVAYIRALQLSRLPRAAEAAP
ncbi:c-type cytochrome [Teichococcus aestuarii]|uniref:c-type cytochrome n=1 Tax=Teichococcus aestuarii TaxID=568898 RepID=UPI00361ED1F8